MFEFENKSQPTRFRGTHLSLIVLLVCMLSLSAVSNTNAQETQQDLGKKVVDKLEEYKQKLGKAVFDLLKEKFKKKAKEAFPEFFEQGETSPEERESLWDDNSELYADPCKKKGLTADPSASYGLLGFMGARYDENGNLDPNGSPLTLKIKGKFPKAQYMSLQLYRGQPRQSSEEVDVKITDFQINPSKGENRFRTGNPNDQGEFEILITPTKDIKSILDMRKDPLNKLPPNHLFYQEKEKADDNSVITAFYRVYLPKGEELKREDLPTIEVYHNGKLVKPGFAKFAKLVKSWYFDLPAGQIFTNIVPKKGEKIKGEELTWVDLNKVFGAVSKALGGDGSGALESLGASEDLRYITSFKRVAIGEYVIVKFRAPAVYYGLRPVDDTTRAVRYWSLVSVYFPRLEGLNSYSCKPFLNEQFIADERDITVVFGKDRPAAKAHAERLGAKFLPDERKESQRVLTFLLRNILPSKAFVREDASEKKDSVEISGPTDEKAQGPFVFEGQYKPTGNVYSLREFLGLTKEDLDKLGQN